MTKRKENVPQTSAVVLRPSAELADLAKLFDPSMMAGVATSGGGLAPFLKLDVDDKTLYDGPTDIGQALDVVILGAAVEHALFPTAYVEDKREDPICFYVGTSEDDAKPDPRSPVPQAETCAKCLKNAFGSNPNGRGGKACSQRRRLLLAPLGDNDDLERQPLRRLRVPTQSMKFLDAYDRLVKSVGLPSLQFVQTTITAEPDKKDRCHLKFEAKRTLERREVEAAARHAEIGRAELFSVWTPKPKDEQAAEKPQAGRRRVVKS